MRSANARYSSVLSGLICVITISLVLDRPKDAKHGDYACNVALQLARALKRKPRDIAADNVSMVAAALANPKRVIRKIFATENGARRQSRPTRADARNRSPARKRRRRT